jgi:hypothetical protein
VPSPHCLHKLSFLHAADSHADETAHTWTTKSDVKSVLEDFKDFAPVWKDLLESVGWPVPVCLSFAHRDQGVRRMLDSGN